MKAQVYIWASYKYEFPC